MRKDAKVTKSAVISAVDRYHGGNFHSENYAFAGFKSNKYFTSDRHIKLNSSFARADGKPLKGYGLEIEMECAGVGNQRVLAEVLNKIIFSHFPEDLFKLENDGSLRGDSSAEAITQIMTKDFIRNNYANFKLMYNEYFPAFKIACGVNCGMHVNISRGCFGRSEAAQIDAVRKLYYIVNHHFDLCCALFNRNTAHVGYCSRMRCDLEYCRGLNPATAGGSHYICFNLSHWNTGRVELRLVAGQKNYAAFRNTMESVFFLVDAVKSLSWADCADPVKIFSGCNQYVYDRLKSYVRDAGQISDTQLAAIFATVKREELI